MQNEAMDMGIGDSVQAQVLIGRIQEALKAANGTRHESDIPKVKKAASLSGGMAPHFSWMLLDGGSGRRWRGRSNYWRWRGQLEEVEMERGAASDGHHEDGNDAWKGEGLLWFSAARILYLVPGGFSPCASSRS